MQSRYYRLFQFLLVVGDLLLLNACFALAMFFRFEEIQLQNTDYYNYYVQLLLFFNSTWLLLTFGLQSFETHRTLEPRKATGKVLKVYFIHIFLLLLVLVSLKKDVYSRLFLIYFYVALLVTIIPWRFFFLRLLRYYRKKGLTNRSILLVGNTKVLAPFLATVQKHPEYGLKIAGVYSNDVQPAISLSGDEQQVIGQLENGMKVDEVYCAFTTDAAYLKWFRLADSFLFRFRMIPDLGIIHSQGVTIDFYHDVPVLVHRKEPLEFIQNRALKRVGDMVFSLLVILLVFPWLLPVLWIGVKLSGPGPVLFKQKRTGLQNREFTIYKFRSMRLNARADVSQAVKNDARLTPFGKFMRKHNLDELPQFFNVLKADMSIIGPRPHMLSHTKAYLAEISNYMVRHLAKPGITGLAQINGYRGEVHTQEDISERVRQDVYYIENWSVLLDLKIILVTLWQTLLGKVGRKKKVNVPT